MKKLIGMVSLIISPLANAGWIYTTGKIEKLVSYAHTETILVYLDKTGTNVEECSNKEVFALSSAMSVEGRARMFSMLLSAQARDEEITLSFLDVGGCEAWFSTPDVYRRIALVTAKS
ncbi:hypothetical protein [Teredinibacter turnerae]|uniref:hypothetical protein n=1 Tax=Teredinibacter turnerae TaxID=2426 RepID=UPI00048D118D|nr:hypothetical protein [Teredinibacter turnerae]